MFKKIVFLVVLLNFNNIKCSDGKEKIKNIKESLTKEINDLYSGENLLEKGEKFKKGKKINLYSVSNIIDLKNFTDFNEKNINEFNSQLLFVVKRQLLLYLENKKNDKEEVKFDNEKERYDIISEYIENINEIKIKIDKKNNTKDLKFNELKKDLEDSVPKINNVLTTFLAYIIMEGFNNIKNKVEDVNFKKFAENEFEYIKDDYFENKKKTLKEKYEFLKNYEEDLYSFFNSAKEACGNKFFSTDDLDSTNYFPKHWKITIKNFEMLKILKQKIYDYEFDNEGIKDKKGKPIIKSIDDLTKEFNSTKNKYIDDFLEKNTRYSNFANYLKLLEEFNNSINDLNIEDNLNFLDKLIENYDNVSKMDVNNVNINTKIRVIPTEDGKKFQYINEKFKEQLSILGKIKLIFNEFSNEKHNELDKKIKNLKQKYDECKNKSDEIKKIKGEIKTLISEIKTKINTLTENNNGLEDKYKVTVNTIDDEDYNKKTKKELNDIENNLKKLEKEQEENIKKQKAEKDEAILATAKTDEEKKKIEASINLREQILAKIKEICEKFEKEYNPIEKDDKIIIEKELDSKLNEYNAIKEYLEDKFNIEKGLSKTLQDCLNSEKTKTINNCELKLNKFLEKKKEEEEKNKDNEKNKNSEDGNNKNIEGDIEDKGKSKCCRSKGEKDNKSKKCCC